MYNYNETGILGMISNVYIMQTLVAVLFKL